MNEQSTENNVPPVLPQQEPADVMTILKNMQQQLVFLERKVDTLLNQSSERPSFGKSHFSKPDRPFGNFNRHKRPYDPNRPKEGNFRQGGEQRPFDGPRGGGADRPQGFGPRKKKFFHRGRGGKV